MLWSRRQQDQDGNEAKTTSTRLSEERYDKGTKTNHHHRIDSVFALAFAAPAYAYFTDVQRASGAQEVDLDYSAEITEKHEDPNGSLYDKVVSIKNTGSSDIMARVFVSDAMDGWTVGASMKDATVWKSEKVTGGTLYTYTPVIRPDETSGELTIEVSGTPEEHWPDFDVIVVGQTSPVAYDDNNKPYGYAWK